MLHAPILIITFAVILLLLCGLWVCFGMMSEEDPSDFSIEEPSEHSPLRESFNAKKSSSISTYEACNGVLSMVPRTNPKPAATAYSILMQAPENLEKTTQPEDLNSSYFQTLTIRRGQAADFYSNKQSPKKHPNLSLYPTNSPVVRNKDAKIKISDEVMSKVPHKHVWMRFFVQSIERRMFTIFQNIIWHSALAVFRRGPWEREVLHVLHEFETLWKLHQWNTLFCAICVLHVLLQGFSNLALPEAS